MSWRLRREKYSLNKEIRQKQEDLMNKLRGDLSELQLTLLLDWDETVNYRNAVEKEQMYLAGVKDRIRLSKQFRDFMSKDC